MVLVVRLRRTGLLGDRRLNLAWRVRGQWHFLRGRTEWGQMTRVGFEQQLTP